MMRRSMLLISWKKLFPVRLQAKKLLHSSSRRNPQPVVVLLSSHHMLYFFCIFISCDVWKFVWAKAERGCVVSKVVIKCEFRTNMLKSIRMITIIRLTHIQSVLFFSGLAHRFSRDFCGVETPPGFINWFRIFFRWISIAHRCLARTSLPFFQQW